MFKIILILFSLFSIFKCKSIEKRQFCNDFAPVNGDCSRYFRCSNGNSYIEQCPAGTLFDPYLRVCNWAAQVTNCNSNVSPINLAYGSSCNANNDYTQVPNDCSRYFRCVNGVYQVQQCPSGTLFDTNLRQCVRAETVTTCFNPQNAYYSTNAYQTYNNGQPLYNPGYNTGYISGQSCNQYQDYTQVPNDCSRYYRCVNGVFVIEACSNGLWFDANLKVCNWPNQVRTCNQY
ncbi:peritrophic membrane [Brachionus plicatilis]|uniref:Peritrophic membrane n=1 Tax=Brachionus plicatilis TaxID=10195 RepID=A0A3M7PD61_BRAPC|nr:peritrophic membrane [Brachionus plicatilis]